jgi:threonine dehydrogenase-like Zn-dependent dehydrogenase
MSVESMNAAVVQKPDQLSVQKMPLPGLADNQVLIRVEYCGICDTDLAIVHGIYSRDHLPLIPGHEFSGSIAEVGGSVSGLSVGDRVTADINLGCEKCSYCRDNARLNCPECSQIGIHSHGAMARYVSAPADKVLPLPQGLDPALGALVEPLSVSVRAAKLGRIGLGQSVVFLACNFMSLLHLQVFKLCGAAPLIVVDPSERRREQAAALGADFTLPQDGATARAVMDLTNGQGADVVVECAGSIPGYELAFDLVRPRGRLLAFGLPAENELARFRPFQVGLRELSIIGSCAGQGEDVEQAITLLQYERLNLTEFTRVRYPLEKINEALAAYEEPDGPLKVLISMS